MVNPVISEKSIEAYFVKKVTQKGGTTVKLTSPGNAGLPDRMIFLPGSKVAFVELKSSIGRLSKLQEKVIAWMAVRGYDVEVLSSKQAVDEWCSSRAI